MSKREKNRMIKAAKELGYSKETVDKLKACDHEAKALKIMKEARHKEL